jgi:3-methylcrotonyl-CoA carboxylase alpha subunit
VLVDGVPTRVDVAWAAAGPEVRLADLGPPYPPVAVLQIASGPSPLYVLHDMRQTEVAWPTYEAGAVDGAADGTSIRAPIIGRVAKVFVKAGDTVAKGDRIAVIEAMKMEHVLHALRDGVIDKVAVAEGQQVGQGALIAALAE